MVSPELGTELGIVVGIVDRVGVKKNGNTVALLQSGIGGYCD